MTDDRPPVADPPTVEPEDPLAADKRTLTIGAIATVGLILVGVVSAQLFARGGCATVVEPRPVAATDVASGPRDAITATLGDVDADAAVALVERTVGAPVTVGAAVGAADAIAALDAGLVTTGATVTSFDGSLAPVATFDTADRLVGDGPTVYDVVLPNERSGQTDALVPLVGADLDVGTCVDTAVVGSPFAFLLDAGDGELLLLRADEDGDRPNLQLRDADEGARWDSRLVLPAGPPGTLAERLGARLGPDAVVAARRVGPQEPDVSPAGVVVDRDDGQVLVELDHATLAAAAQLDVDGPIRWQPVAVGTDTAIIHGRPDPADVADDAEVTDTGALVLIDLAAGDAVTAVTGVGPPTAVAVDRAAPDDRYAVATSVPGTGQVDLIVLDGAGQLRSFAGDVADVDLAWSGGDVLIAARDSFTRWSPDGSDGAVDTLEGASFSAVTVTTEGRVAVLVTGRDGGDAVLLVSTRADDPLSATAGSADP